MSDKSLTRVAVANMFRMEGFRVTMHGPHRPLKIICAACGDEYLHIVWPLRYAPPLPLADEIAHLRTMIANTKERRVRHVEWCGQRRRGEANVREPVFHDPQA